MVAERKVVSLLLSGGVVTLISPQATAFLESLARAGQIGWHSRQCQELVTRAGCFSYAPRPISPKSTQPYLKMPIKGTASAW